VHCKMKLFVAHSGEQLDTDNLVQFLVRCRTQSNTSSEANEPPTMNINLLKQWIESVSNISVQNQILLNSRGVKLEEEQLLSEQENESIFVFDRSTFVKEKSHDNSYGSFEPIRSMLKLQELDDSQIPTSQILQVSNSDIDSVFKECTKSVYISLKKSEHILSYGKLKFDALNRLVQEQKNQARAIECSNANLNAHTENIITSFKSFLLRFQKNEERFNLLLSSFEDDLKQLAKIELHPKLSSESRKTLLDCVPEKQLRQWAPKCQRELEMFKEKLQQGIELANSIRKAVESENIPSPSINIAQLSEYVQKAAISLQKEKHIVDTISNDYNILADMIVKQKINSSALPSMVKNHETHVQQMREYDAILEQILNSCIESKIDLTNELIDKLRNISQIQYNIKRLSRKLSAYITILRNIISKFAHLEVIHFFPGAYSLSLVEILRRRKFLRTYSSEIVKCSNRLNQLREEEVLNRRQFEKHFARFLPPGLIPGLYEKLPLVNFGQSASLFMETSLPSIDNAQEISNIDLGAIQVLCGSVLGQGVLKMYATTLDENQMFHQMEFSTEVDTSLHQVSSYNSKGAMFHSHSSSVQSTGSLNPSYMSDYESPGQSPSNSPRSITSLDNKLSQYKKQISERDLKIEKMEKELAILESQIMSASRVKESNMNEEMSQLLKENAQLKETVNLKEKLRHEMAQKCEVAIRESQKLKEILNRYMSAIKQLSEVALEKSTDNNRRKVLNQALSQLHSSDAKSVNLDELVDVLSSELKK
jgi:hypothetical protein